MIKEIVFVCVRCFVVVSHDYCFATCIHLIRLRAARALTLILPFFAFYFVVHLLLVYFSQFILLCANGEHRAARTVNWLFAQTYEMHTRTVPKHISSPATTNSQQCDDGDGSGGISSWFDSIKLFSLHYYDMKKWYFLRLFSELYLLRRTVHNVCAVCVFFCSPPTQNEEADARCTKQFRSRDTQAKSLLLLLHFATHSIENCWRSTARGGSSR